MEQSLSYEQIEQLALMLPPSDRQRLAEFLWKNLRTSIDDRPSIAAEDSPGRDPLLEMLGTISFERQDLCERLDDYIGESFRDHGSEDRP